MLFMHGRMKRPVVQTRCRNDKITADKYCERGAEWGVGDCSLQGLTAADKKAFRTALKVGGNAAE